MASKLSKRAFEAAKISRTLAYWATQVSNINEDLKNDLDSLRARSRDLAQNDTTAKRFLTLQANNVAGSAGFTLQAKATDATNELDKVANDAIEAGYDTWSKCGNYEVTGKMHRIDGERLISKILARDGEVLIREIKESSINDFGYSLQFLDVNRLATDVNRNRENGRNAIIMGVEVNDFGRPMFYHLYKDVNRRNKDINIIPASEIIHQFVPDNAEQIRGTPGMHASMIKMRQLKKYNEIALIAAGVGASKMGFFTTQDGDGAAVADKEDEDTGQLYTEAVPGVFDILPQGTDFKTFDPDYPHQMFADFVKTNKRDISTGLGVSYHALANDLEGVNFSSIRAGVLEDRENYMSLQSFIINCILDRIYENWLKQALLKRAIVTETGAVLPANKASKFLKHLFIGRRWPWVDPLKDIQAAILAKDNNLASPINIITQQGGDPQDVVDDIKTFQEMLGNLASRGSLTVADIDEDDET